MRNAANLLCALLALAISTSGQARLQPPRPPAATLIKAGRILDVKSGKYLLDQGILTEGEKIKEIGPWTEVQAHASREIAVIDLSQATLLPGLIDCHAHLLSSGEIRRGPVQNIAITLPQFSESLRALMGAANAKEELEAGITSARVLGHSGIDGDVALRDAINAGLFPGPRLQAAARKIAPVGGQMSSAGDSISPQEFLAVSGPDEARRAVRENSAIGVDLIKIVIDAGSGRNGKTRYISLEDAKAIVEDAHRLGLKVAAHAEDRVAVQIAIDAQVDSIEHAWTATDEQLKQMKEKGIFLVATDLLVPTSTKDRLLRAMSAGVKIAMGSDVWMVLPDKTRGEATLLELEALHKEGMANLEIIRSSTLNAAELMGWSDQVGELAAGKFADIIAVQGDPDQDLGLLQHVKFVMKGSTVFKNEFAQR